MCCTPSSASGPFRKHSTPTSFTAHLSVCVCVCATLSTRSKADSTFVRAALQRLLPSPRFWPSHRHSHGLSASRRGAPQIHRGPEFRDVYFPFRWRGLHGSTRSSSSQTQYRLGSLEAVSFEFWQRRTSSSLLGWLASSFLQLSAASLTKLNVLRFGKEVTLIPSHKRRSQSASGKSCAASSSIGASRWLTGRERFTFLRCIGEVQNRLKCTFL